MSSFILLHKDNKISQHHLLKEIVFPPVYVFGSDKDINHVMHNQAGLLLRKETQRLLVARLEQST